MSRSDYTKLAENSPSSSPKLTTAVKDLEVRDNIIYSSLVASSSVIFGTWRKTGDNEFSCGAGRKISFSKDGIDSAKNESYMMVSNEDLFTRYTCHGKSPHYLLRSQDGYGVSRSFNTVKEIAEDINYQIKQSEDLIEALDGKSVGCGCSVM